MSHHPSQKHVILTNQETILLQSEINFSFAYPDDKNVDNKQTTQQHAKKCLNSTDTTIQLNRFFFIEVKNFLKYISKKELRSICVDHILEDDESKSYSSAHIYVNKLVYIAS